MYHPPRRQLMAQIAEGPSQHGPHEYGRAEDSAATSGTDGAASGENLHQRQEKHGAPKDFSIQGRLNPAITPIHHLRDQKSDTPQHQSPQSWFQGLGDWNLFKNSVPDDIVKQLHIYIAHQGANYGKNGIRQQFHRLEINRSRKK